MLFSRMMGIPLGGLRDSVIGGGGGHLSKGRLRLATKFVTAAACAAWTPHNEAPLGG